MLLALVARKVRIGARAVVRWLTGLALAVALAELLASAFIVHAVHQVYVIAATSEAFQQNLREFEEFRKERRARPSPP